MTTTTTLAMCNEEKDLRCSVYLGMPLRIIGVDCSQEFYYSNSIREDLSRHWHFMSFSWSTMSSMPQHTSILLANVATCDQKQESAKKDYSQVLLNI